MVIVRVFNKNLTGENQYTDVDYGQVAELVTYMAAKKRSDVKKKKEEE